MRFGSIFSGIGGFDLGFEQAGLSCLWQVEIDKDCQRVLSKQWPNVIRYKDVRDIGKLESVDVICGGFPCQDLSVAGKRAGLAGERSGLWFEFLRIIGLNRPRFIVIENVPGLLSSWSPVEPPPDAVEGCEWDVEENSDFEIILVGLSELGYCLASRILDAQYDGVAQRRERVFIVGSLGDGSSAEILFESESVSWDPPTRREAGPGVTPILEAGARTNGDGQRDGDGIGVEGDPMFTLQSGKQHGVAGSLAAHAKKHGHAMTTQQAAESGHLVSMPLKSKANSSHDESHESYVVAEALRTKRPGEGGIAGDDTHIVASALMGHSGLHDSGGQQTFVTHALRSEGADASEDGTGRGTPLVVANCFNGYTGGAGDNDAQANHLIAFSSKDHGADAGEIAPTLRSQNFKDSHMNGGGQVAIAFAENQRGEIRTSEVSPQISCAGGKPGSGYPAIAFTERTRAFGPHSECQEELAYAVTNSGKGGRTNNRQIAGNFGVRRLTPRECERLQSFPDDFTRWDANGKEISDSARYRMLGNAVCVNVARWIGQRMIEAEQKIS